MYLTTEQILDYFENNISKQSFNNLNNGQNLQYKVYICAPFWTLEQAVCLLAGIKTVDAKTFQVLISLEAHELEINRQCFNKNDCSVKYKTFRDFVIRKFSIPHKKIHHIRNLNDILIKAIRDKELNSKLEPIENITTHLLYPNDVITFNKKKNLSPSLSILLPLILKSIILEKVKLPQKTFPNEVDGYGYWMTWQNTTSVEKTNVNFPKQTCNEQVISKSVFISYVYKDESDRILAAKLYQELNRRGIKDVWWDEAKIKIGESITDEISKGLENHQFIVIIFSKAYLENERYAKKEYKGAIQLCLRDANKKILPIWKDIGSDEISNYDPSLLDRSARKFSNSLPLDSQVEDIVEAILEWF